MKAKLIAASVLLAVGFIGGYWVGNRGIKQSALLPTPLSAGDAVVTSVESPAQPVAQKVVTVHVATAIGTAQVTTEADVSGARDTTTGTWSFKDQRLDFSFDPKTKKAHYKFAQSFAVQVLLEKDRRGTTKASGAVWELRDGKAFRELPVQSWEVTTVEPATDAGSSHATAAVEQSVGIGASIGGWRDASPCLTYSVFRVGRLRLPSAMIDIQAHAGPGVQGRIWRPIHVGAFYTWDLLDIKSTAVRITATVNL